MMKPRAVDAVVVDIEGTISPIAFAKDILFPFAAKNIEPFLKANAEKPHVAEIINEVRAFEGEPEMPLDKVVQTLLLWIKLDKKITPLKTLQGIIWEAGYRRGLLKGQLYADAVAKLTEWQAGQLPLYVYSSGSISAQKLLFAHTDSGDLTKLFSGYFDTTTGSKLDPQSYKAIATAIGIPAGLILFLSDHAGELDAARTAEWQTVFVDRGRMGGGGSHATINDFSEIRLPVQG